MKKISCYNNRNNESIPIIFKVTRDELSNKSEHIRIINYSIPNCEAPIFSLHNKDFRIAIRYNNELYEMPIKCYNHIYDINTFVILLTNKFDELKKTINPIKYNIETLQFNYNNGLYSITCDKYLLSDNFEFFVNKNLYSVLYGLPYEQEQYTDYYKIMLKDGLYDDNIEKYTITQDFPSIDNYFEQDLIIFDTPYRKLFEGIITSKDIRGTISITNNMCVSYDSKEIIGSYNATEIDVYYVTKTGEKNRFMLPVGRSAHLFVELY